MLVPSSLPQPQTTLSGGVHTLLNIKAGKNQITAQGNSVAPVSGAVQHIIRDGDLFVDQLPAFVPFHQLRGAVDSTNNRPTRKVLGSLDRQINEIRRP